MKLLGTLGIWDIGLAMLASAETKPTPKRLLPERKSQRSGD
jgi:hypothetical protein